MTADPAVRVLLVEDNPDDAALIRAVLRRGARTRVLVEHHDRLEAAIAHLESSRTDIVLLDFSLPDSFGLETYRRLHEAHPSVPVIVLTSLDDDQLALSAVSEGAQDYLVKSELDPRLLSRAIRYAIERFRAEEALRESQQRYALAAEGANDGLWDWDIAADQLYLSPRWRDMLGLDPSSETPNRSTDWLNRVHAADLPTFSQALQTHLAGDEGHFELEHRMVDGSGAERWMLTRGLVVRDSHGRPQRMAGSLTDITARKLAEQQLLHDAFHDGLTGLANRALFVDRLSVLLAADARRHQRRFAVLFLDLDRFKTINDSLGHGVGDQLLIRVARRIERLIRPGDTIARLGGDEFAALVGDIRGPGDAVQVAERMLEEIARPCRIDGHDILCTASIGIAIRDDGERSAESMLRDADLAMYRAKAAGKARYEIYDGDMHAAAMRLLQIESELRRAVENNDFVMHYQPIVSLVSGRIVGFEALVRWDHAERGLIAPTQFIGLAEETGLIVPLGWWVLDQACLQVRQWQQRFPSEPLLFASVNVSGKLFSRPDSVDRIVEVIERTGLPPESLRLEVTESVVLEHGEEVVNRLLELRALGVQLSIDDFGTGYSSLTYLQRFHYDTLKIDRSFVSRMGSAGDSRSIVEAILQLASSLGIGVVAEGFERRCPRAR